MIYEQKYLECIEGGNLSDAVILLRQNLKKNCEDKQKLHKLARFQMKEITNTFFKSFNVQR